MKRKTGIICDCIAGEDPCLTAERIKKAGFDTTFTAVYDPQKVAQIKHKCDEIGLELEFIHAPYDGINEMWNASSDCPLFSELLTLIDTCAQNGIPAIVLHISSGWNAPQVNDIGLTRFDEIVAYATGKGVIVAFENLRKVGNLAMMVDRYEGNDCVKFCYDCGHEHCNSVTVCLPDLFTDRMAYTHLHDNFGAVVYRGENDYHLLPFDGTVNFQKVADKLDEYGYTGSLMLEVFNTNTHAQGCKFDFSAYAAMSADEFLQECYDRVCKINALSRKTRRIE